MKRIVGWVLRGGEHTRAALDEHAAAIQQLQGRMEEAHAPAVRSAELPDQIRRVADDLGERLVAVVDRLDGIEARLGALEESVDELVRIVAPGDAE